MVAHPAGEKRKGFGNKEMTKKHWFVFSLVGLLWGIPYLLIREAVKEVSPDIVVFARVVIGSAVIAPLLINRGVYLKALKSWPHILFYAIGEMVIPWILISDAERRLNSGLAGLLVATVPLWSTIIQSFLGDKSVWHKTRLLGMILGFIGIFLTVGVDSFKGQLNLWAVAEVIIGSISYAIASTYITVKASHVNVMAINQIALTMTAIIYLPFAILSWPTHHIHSKTIIYLIILGLIPTALAFVLYFDLIRHMGQARGSMVTYLNTAWAVTLGIILLHEPLTAGIIVGLPLILFGSYLASKKLRTSKLMER
jgi:drug/metabolite transporter (DMT)-like permease